MKDTDSVDTPASPEPKPGPLNEVEVWSALLNQAFTAGSDVTQLFALEVRLALGDARRMFWLMLLAVPFVLLTWVSFAGLIAWLVSYYSDSVTLGLLAFLVQHLAILVYFLRLGRRYLRSFTLPKTRQHLQAIIEITRTGDFSQHDTRTPDP